MSITFTLGFHLWHVVPALTTVVSIFAFFLLLKAEYFHDAFFMALALWCLMNIPAFLVAFLI